VADIRVIWHKNLALNVEYKTVTSTSEDTDVFALCLKFSNDTSW